MKGIRNCILKRYQILPSDGEPSPAYMPVSGHNSPFNNVRRCCLLSDLCTLVSFLQFYLDIFVFLLLYYFSYILTFFQCSQIIIGPRVAAFRTTRRTVWQCFAMCVVFSVQTPLCRLHCVFHTTLQNRNFFNGSLFRQSGRTRISQKRTREESQTNERLQCIGAFCWRILNQAEY